ncbi:hypothetical protein [Salinibacter ruber]|uniref:hypothetical protein n=1 Tax=Salinibacter ruber TaxID=146919 RepID=UPI0020744B5F|nr:hypothetical protein [Salinibacter ruber]
MNIVEAVQTELDLGISHGQIYKWSKKLNSKGQPEKALTRKGNMKDAKIKALKRWL